MNKIDERQNIFMLIVSEFKAIGYLVAGDNVGKREICRETKHKNIKKVFIPDELKEIETLNPRDFGQFNEYVSNFINTLSSIYPKEYLKNLYMNINSLTIKKRTSMLFNVGGCYSSITNTIKITESDYVYHELMHMASRPFDSKLVSGFKNCHALTEGYTELLTARHFQNNKPNAYFLEVKIAEILENIVGPGMTKLFFEADGLGLVKELKKLSSEKEILEFFKNFDYMSIVSRDLDKNIEQNTKLFKEYLKDVYNYLTKIYFVSLMAKLEEGKITEEEFHEMQNKFLEENMMVRFLYSWWPTYSFDYVDELKENFNTYGKSKI